MQPITKERKIKERPLKWIAFSKGHMFSFVCHFFNSICSVSLSYSERLPLDSSSLWSVIQSEVLTLLLQEKMHSLVLIFEADSRNSMQCSAGGTSVAPITTFRGNYNDSDMEHKAFYSFNICCFKAISVVLIFCCNWGCSSGKLTSYDVIGKPMTS